jgi:two-component system NtrC family sensor kinase
MIIGLIFSTLAILCLYELLDGPAAHFIHSSSLWYVLVAVAVCAAAYLWLEIFVLRRLHKGLLKAREGLLEAVPINVLRWTSVGKVINEYNITIEVLKSMFKTVEECQGRFINQRNKMNTLLQSLPGALLSLSDDLHIVMLNKQAEDMFKGGQAPLIGANLFDLLYLGEQDRELLRDAFLYKRPIQNQEIQLATAEGPRRYSLNLGFYSDEDNDMGGVLILRDISDYRRLQDNMIMQERLIAMGQLAAGVAHELNTPIGSIRGFTQLLSQSFAPNSQQGKYLKFITDETIRCSRIVQDLLNFARTDRCTGEVCEINQLIRELIETFLNCRMKRYKIDVKLDLLDHPLVAEGSCGQLDIVLTNLITNAIHAVENVENPVITLSARAEETYIVISVADNGPGVPVEFRKRIFDPFFTTKDVGQGSGLGLPICHAILTKRGGQIEYDDAHFTGARFLIKLPAVDLHRAGLEAAATNGPAALVKKENGQIEQEPVLHERA